ncbi:MAG: DegT/DnrJ/EryC1/StrS family aminotransferase [Chloroflexi bacterium]|nr:DegT/DnrJ/EryC1/StrS family aminotransferase [Chloroflexota bacterium]
MNVSFVDLRAQHEQVRAEIEAAIKDIIDRSSFIGGAYVSNFEKDFAAYLGVKEAIAVANGTDALWLGLLAAGVQPGDAVITVPNTFIATVEAITRCGAHPLFVDIDLATANMDVNALRTLLETQCAVEQNGQVTHIASRRKVTAILPVHLYGLPVDITSLLELSQKFAIPLVEDTCQAHGARYLHQGEWKRAGALGVAAGYSFYPGKNLGAMGDGGAVVTNDPELAGKMRWLRDHGQSERYVHVTAYGWNSRLDSLQAAILNIKLKKLDEWNAARRAAAARYNQALTGLPLELPIEPQNSEHIYHLYVVRAADRETLRKGLNERGVGTGLHYPIPLHLQKAYEYLGLGAGSFSQTELSASTLLSLPMHPALTAEQIDYAAAACAEILQVKAGV